MKKLYVVLLMALCLVTPSFALDVGLVGVTEVDTSPACYVYKLIFTNGSVTCNADSTATVTTGGGSFDVTSVTGQTEDTAPTSDDQVLTVNAPGGSPALRKASLANLYKAWKGYADIPAGSMIPDTSSGLLQKDSTNIVDYLGFSGVADQAAMFSFSLEDWDLGTIKAKFVWGPSSEDNAQTVVWCLTCYAVSNEDTYDVALTAGPQCAAADALVADSWSALKQHITAATGALTVQGTPAAGDVVYCKVYRDVSEDDYEHDAWLFRVKIEYGKTTPTAW